MKDFLEMLEDLVEYAMLAFFVAILAGALSGVVR